MVQVVVSELVRKTNPLSADLDHVLAHTQGLWEELCGQRIL